jgi:predicted metal-dependent hydrolase
MRQPYVPGQTARPDEGAFDALKDVSGPLETCVAWRAGWDFFERGFYWEAHEVWEAVWMAAPERSKEKLLVQGMIQRANAKLKARMGRAEAAARIEAKAARLLSEAFRDHNEVLKLSADKLQYNAQD